MTVYKSLDEWQKATGLDLNKFEPIKSQGLKDRFKPKQPIVGITKYGFTFNSYITTELGITRTYVRPFLQIGPGQLMFMFTDKKEAGQYKVQKSGKYSTFSTMGKVIETLNNDSDYINTNAYKYRFIPTLADKENHRIIVDLKGKPYSKTKVK